MAPRGKGAWTAALATVLAAVACVAHAPAAPSPAPEDTALAETPGAAAEPAAAPSQALEPDPPPDLEPSPSSEARIGLSALLFPREDHPSLLNERLLISGIDPREVRDFLQAYNRRSEIGQFTPDGFSPAPHALERMLNLPPGQVLQFRWSGQVGKLVFQFTWR